jgi:hypothetical protein
VGHCPLRFGAVLAALGCISRRYDHITAYCLNCRNKVPGVLRPRSYEFEWSLRASCHARTLPYYRAKKLPEPAAPRPWCTYVRYITGASPCLASQRGDHYLVATCWLAGWWPAAHPSGEQLEKHPSLSHPQCKFSFFTLSVHHPIVTRAVAFKWISSNIIWYCVLKMINLNATLITAISSSEFFLEFMIWPTHDINCLLFCLSVLRCDIRSNCGQGYFFLGKAHHLSTWLILCGNAQVVRNHCHAWRKLISLKSLSSRTSI